MLIFYCSAVLFFLTVWNRDDVEDKLSAMALETNGAAEDDVVESQPAKKKKVKRKIQQLYQFSGCYLEFKPISSSVQT